MRIPHLIPFAILAAGCGGVGALPAHAAPAKPATAAPVQLPPGTIAFRRFFDADQTYGAIFTIKTDGTGEKQLTDPGKGTVDNYPDWSPDGTQVAFDRCAPGKLCSVWTVSAHGGKPHKLRVKCKLGNCDASGPAWMPDGKLVVTLSQGRLRMLNGADQIEQSGLELVDPRTGKQRTILAVKHWKGDLMSAAPSPDGHQLVYSRGNSALGTPPLSASLFAVNLDGSNDHQVTPWELGDGDHAVFSPAGTVLFRSYDGDDSKQSDFWTVNPDGTALQQLTHFPKDTIVRSASYSPDGAWIVHATNGIGGNADLFVMRADGTGNQPLTRTKLWDSAPDWSPR